MLDAAGSPPVGWSGIGAAGAGARWGGCGNANGSRFQVTPRDPAAHFTSIDENGDAHPISANLNDIKHHPGGNGGQNREHSLHGRIGRGHHDVARAELGIRRNRFRVHSFTVRSLDNVVSRVVRTRGRSAGRIVQSGVLLRVAIDGSVGVVQLLLPLCVSSCRLLRRLDVVLRSNGGAGRILPRPDRRSRHRWRAVRPTAERWCAERMHRGRGVAGELGRGWVSAPTTDRRLPPTHRLPAEFPFGRCDLPSGFSTLFRFEVVVVCA